MEIQIENLRAKIRGKKLSHYQEGLALDEFEKLIAHTEALTEQLRQYNVAGNAYLVTVGCKSGVYRVIVLAKTEAECMNKVQLNFKDCEWQDVRECFGKPLL